MGCGTQSAHPGSLWAPSVSSSDLVIPGIPVWAEICWMLTNMAACRRASDVAGFNVAGRASHSTAKRESVRMTTSRDGCVVRKRRVKHEVIINTKPKLAGVVSVPSKGEVLSFFRGQGKTHTRKTDRKIRQGCLDGLF